MVSKCISLISPVVNDVTEYRIDSPLFNIQLKEDNILGIRVDCNNVLSGIAASDGYWIMLNPLDPSQQHNLHMKVQGTYEDESRQLIPFTTDVTYSTVSQPDAPTESLTK